MSGGKATVRDGPFAEAKELVAGFAVVDVKSKAEAVEAGRQVPDDRGRRRERRARSVRADAGRRIH